MELRLSPSGPVVGDITTGHIVQSASRTLPEFESDSFGSNTVIRPVNTNMFTQGGEPLRVGLPNFKEGHRLRVEADLLVNKQGTYSTTSYEVKVQVSADNGANWSDVFTMFQSQPASANTGGRNFPFTVRTETIDPSVVTGFVDGGQVLARIAIRQSNENVSPTQFTGDLTNSMTAYELTAD